MAPNPKLPDQSFEQHVEALDLTLSLSLPQRPPTYDNVLGMQCSNPNPNPDPNPNPNLMSSDPLVAPWPLLVQNNDPHSVTSRCLRNPNAYVMMPCWVAPERGTAMYAAQMQCVNGNESAGTGDLARAPTAVGPFHGGSSSKGSSCVREGRKRCEIPGTCRCTYVRDNVT